MMSHAVLAVLEGTKIKMIGRAIFQSASIPELRDFKEEEMITNQSRARILAFLLKLKFAVLRKCRGTLC